MRAIIDRIEGKMAVVLVGDYEEKIDIPLANLPKGVKEGSCLKVHFEIDRDEELNRRKRIQERLNRLKGRNINISPKGE
jgi:hypothetical protein